MLNRLILSVPVCLALLQTASVCRLARAQEEAADLDDDRVAADEPDVDAGIRDMIARAHSMQLRVGGQQDVVRVAERPIFRFSDAARGTIDGTLWLWEQSSEPLAILSLFREYQAEEAWNYEFVLLAEGPLDVSGRPGWSWQPERKPREWHALSAPSVAAREGARLVQMKGLARRLTATERLDGETYQLRLLPNPIHRYSRPDEEVTDGAVFLFAYGTNPEVVVQLEALDDSPEWRVAFSRLGAAELVVQLDQAPLWEAEQVLEWNEQAEYFSHYSADPLEDAASRQLEESKP